MALPKFLCAGKCLASPHFFRNIAESDRVDLSRLDDAAKSLLQVVDLNDISRRIASVAVFAIRLVVRLDGVGRDGLPAIYDAARETVIVIVRPPKRSASFYGSSHLLGLPNACLGGSELHRRTSDDGA